MWGQRVLFSGFAAACRWHWAQDHLLQFLAGVAHILYCSGCREWVCYLRPCRSLAASVHYRRGFSQGPFGLCFFNFDGSWSSLGGAMCFDQSYLLYGCCSSEKILLAGTAALMHRKNYPRAQHYWASGSVSPILSLTST